MSKVTLKGKVHKLFDQQDFPSGFYKRDLVVQTDDRFPQTVPVTFAKEKSELLKNLVEGQEVTVHCDVRGREWNDRFFVDLNGWKIEEGEKPGDTTSAPSYGAAPSAPAAPAPAAPAPPLEHKKRPEDNFDDDDDVPF